MSWFNLLILWVHLLAASFLVGGSLFFWLIVIPESYSIGKDEANRTLLVGRLAKRFGRIVNWTIIVLIATGLYNLTWYVGSVIFLFTPYGRLMLLKMGLVAVFLVLLYLHNFVFGRRITKYAREGKIQELQALRKKSRVVSFTNVILMLLIMIFAVFLRVPV